MPNGDPAPGPTELTHDERRRARRMLDLAARAGLRGAGDVEPNPMVGAVIARGDEVLGVGHHRRFGGLHAEREALESCRRQGHDPRGATCYVTLEPCRHFGKQPPCTDAILAAGVARVVYARADPGEHSGGGAALLRARGVACAPCDASPAATRLSDPFIRRSGSDRPWVIVKWAQTIDGRIATRTGESQWISGPLARARVHRLRARVDAVLTGLGTVLADDPLLTARGVRRVRRLARRVVVDTNLDIPPDRRLVRTAREVPTFVACDKDLALATISADRRRVLERAGLTVLGVPGTREGLDLGALLRGLRESHAVASVLVEAGPGLIGAFLSQGLADELLVFVAPKIMGDDMARGAASGRSVPRLGDALGFELVRSKRVGPDMELVYRRSGVARWADAPPAPRA